MCRNFLALIISGRDIMEAPIIDDCRDYRQRKQTQVIKPFCPGKMSITRIVVKVKATVKFCCVGGNCQTSCYHYVLVILYSACIGGAREGSFMKSPNAFNVSLLFEMFTMKSLFSLHCNGRVDRNFHSHINSLVCYSSVPKPSSLGPSTILTRFWLVYHAATRCGCI